MSGAPDLAQAPRFSAANPAAREGPKLSANWLWRPLFGFLLAGIAVAATVLGGLPFVIFLTVGCTAGIREWHRLFTCEFAVPAAITAVAMIAAFLEELYPRYLPASGNAGALAILALGGLCNLVLGMARKQAPAANAAGVLYIAFPALTLLMVRQSAAQAIWSVVFIFLAVWSTDTGALFAGRLIGGPKLAPRLSPKKTWAGSLGGLVCAAAIAGGLALLLHVRAIPAVAFAVALSIAGQVGDLFESMVKRRTGCKDSGGLIPGHGGVLDRIDSILFAAPVAAALIFLLGWNPVAGAHL